jgi:two-component system, cell cycle sensor histidine kinase and response regulator CckA
MSERPGAQVVLVVEDERLVRSVVQRMLESAGHDVLLAKDAAEAIDTFLRRGQIDLVVTDLSMPGMSGQELATELRALDPSVRVLFLSGYPGADVALDAHSDFLAKPFSREAFMQKAARLLAR